MKLLFLSLLGALLAGQLGAIPVFPGVTIYAHDFVVGLLLLYGIWLAWKKNYRPPGILLWPIMAFFLAGLLSLMVNSSYFSAPILATSALYLLRWISYAGLYALAASGMIERKLIIRGLYAYGVSFAVLGFLQYVWYPDMRNLVYLGWDPHFYRLVSTVFDPNFAAIIIVLTLLLGVVVRKHAKRAWVVDVCQIASVVALYLTHSRSGLVAFIVVCVSWILAKKQWKWLAALAGVALLVILIPTPGGDTLRLLRADSSIARIENWQSTIARIGQRPVFGYGFNTLPYMQTRFYGDFPSRTGGGVDSSILFVIMTSGVVGLLAFGWLGLRMWRHAYASKQGDLGLIFRLGLVGILVHSLFLNSAFYPLIMIWVWLVAGAISQTEVGRTKKH